MDVEAIRALFAEASLGGPDKAVGFVLWRVMHRYQRAVERALAPHELTHLQFTTLAMTAWMCRSGDFVTQAELAREADIHPMQISLMLKALESKGMVARRPSTTDTRTRLVGITPAGIKALRTALPIIVELQQQMFGNAGAPGGALLNALRSIEKPDE